jgi:hypothetical protein
MAGSIVISKDNIWADATMTLDAIAFRTGEAFPPECAGYKEAIYSELEIFQFLALDEVDADGFNCFCRATSQAFERFRTAGPRPDWPADYYPGMVKAWSKLLTQLSQDPRYRGPSPPTP